MAKKISGEVSLKHGNKTYRLRLSIDAMFELEDYFNMGIIPFISERLPEMRIKDMAFLLALMTGKDISDKKVIKKSGSDVIAIGFLEAVHAITNCIEATLISGDDTKPGKKPPKKVTATSTP